MTREEILKETILTKYGSISKFAKENGIPDSSIRNIFNRGLEGASIGLVVKICKILQLDVESLMDHSLSLRPNPVIETAVREYVTKLDNCEPHDITNGQQKKPADQMVSGLRDTGYDELTPENKEAINSLIAKLLKSQSVE